MNDVFQWFLHISIALSNIKKLKTKLNTITEKTINNLYANYGHIKKSVRVLSYHSVVLLWA